MSGLCMLHADLLSCLHHRDNPLLSSDDYF